MKYFRKRVKRGPAGLCSEVWPESEDELHLWAHFDRPWPKPEN